MRIYPDQPDEPEEVMLHPEPVARFIRDFLKEELPECRVNEWFLETVYFANMCDNLTEDLFKEFLNQRSI
jgi:hypothetical protein